MAAKFELKRAKNGKHFFNLLAGNGEPILSSQMYASRSGARNGIASVRAHAKDQDCYERRKGKSGKVHFVLKARNHRVIGSSETYNSNAAMENGIKSVIKNGAAKMVVAQ